MTDETTNAFDGEKALTLWGEHRTLYSLLHVVADDQPPDVADLMRDAAESIVFWVKRASALLAEADAARDEVKALKQALLEAESLPRSTRNW